MIDAGERGRILPVWIRLAVAEVVVVVVAVHDGCRCCGEAVNLAVKLKAVIESGESKRRSFV